MLNQIPSIFMIALSCILLCQYIAMFREKRANGIGRQDVAIVGVIGALIAGIMTDVILLYFQFDGHVVFPPIAHSMFIFFGYTILFLLFIIRPVLRNDDAFIDLDDRHNDHGGGYVELSQ